MILLIIIIAIAAATGAGFIAVKAKKTDKSEPIEETAAVAQVHSIATDIDSFVDFMQPLESLAQRQGYAPGVITAHVAQETGYGRRVIGKNLFNIKASTGWSGKSVRIKTWEYTPENQVYAYFRDYATYVDSLTDYMRLISSGAGGRYSNAWKSRQEPEQYFVQLTAAGYATDPVYSQNLITRYQAVKDLVV